MRVEILSLSLRPEGRVARDSSVVRLFVEYSLLDLPTEETPLSLPKPPRGKSINYNYSKGEAPRRTRLHLLTDTLHVCFVRAVCDCDLAVIPIDAEKNNPRRRLLRAVLRGQNPEMER